MPSHFKVHELLSGEQLEKLEAFAREPGRTVDECHEWVQALGFTLSRGAVGNWKRDFDGRVMQERFSRSSELARTIKAAVAGGDFGDVADAAAMQLTQVVFEQASRLEADGEIDALDVQRMTKSLNNLVTSKRGLVELLAGKFDQEAKKLVTAKREITQDDIESVRKAVFG